MIPLVSPACLVAVRIAILALAALLAILDPRLRRLGLHAHPGAARRALAALYFALAAVAGCTFVARDGPLPHWSEQYHFDLGDKYLREVRYDALYAATSAAIRERGLPREAAFVRDPTTFAPVVGFELLAREAEARARFTPERWQAFGDDLAALLANDPTAASTDDHGNTASPSGALGPWLLLHVVPLRGAGFAWLACADLAALLAVFLACWRWASIRVAAFAIVVALLPPNVSLYLLGSLARFDWLAAAMLGTLALHRRRWTSAGALFAYAALARPFAATFAVGAVIGVGGDVYARRVARGALVHLCVGGAIGGAALVLASAIVFGWPVWPAYAARAAATVREAYYEINHGLRDVITQVARDGVGALIDPSPSTIAAASGARVPSTLLGLARVALGALLVTACARDGGVTGAGLGAPYAFVTVVTNAYYQSMWAVLALACALHAPTSRRARIGLALTCAMLALRWLPFAAPAPALDVAPYYFASWTSLAFVALWVAPGLLTRPMRAAPRRAE